MKKKPERVYHYKIDKEGRLWIEGTELTDPTTLKFFMGHLENLPHGKFRVMCMGETNMIEVEDVPYVVQDIKIFPEKIELIFPGGYREDLDPATLKVGRDNVLYCRVRSGEFSARFNRRPYLELSRMVEKDPGHHYYLKLGKKRYLIQGVVEEDFRI